MYGIRLVKPVLATLLVAAALAPAAASAAARPVLRPTLKGTCTSTDRLDANGVITSSTFLCKATGVCYCSSRKTRLAFASRWTSPGTGAPGPERGTIIATDANATATLQISGTRNGSGQSRGTWVLGKVTGLPRSGFRSRGTYTLQTRTIGSDLGAKTTIRISAGIDCWRC